MVMNGHYSGDYRGQSDTYEHLDLQGTRPKDTQKQSKYEIFCPYSYYSSGVAGVPLPFNPHRHELEFTMFREGVVLHRFMVCHSVV